MLQLAPEFAGAAICGTIAVGWWALVAGLSWEIRKGSANLLYLVKQAAVRAGQGARRGSGAIAGSFWSGQAEAGGEHSLGVAIRAWNTRYCDENEAYGNWHVTA